MIQGDPAELDDIISALYECISGPAGVPRDWDRFRTLLKPEAHLIRTGVSSEGETAYEAHTVESFIRNADPFFKEHSFFESEISRKTETFGNIAHVFSTYAGRRSPEGEPFLRGINSIQLARKDGRWFIETIFWQAETDEFPLPPKYLD